MKSYTTYSFQNGYGHICVPYETWLLISLWKSMLSWDTLPTIAWVHPNWSFKRKGVGSRQVHFWTSIVSHMQHFVPYTMLSLCFEYIEQPNHKLGQKLIFFLKFDKFWCLKLFLWDCSSSANLFWNLGMFT